MPSQTARLHQLSVGSDILATTSLYPSAFFWTSCLNQSSLSHILVYSHTFLDTDDCLSLISAPVCLTTLSVDRMPTCRTGVIHSVRYQHSDGAMHFYTLDIATPDWQLTQSIHTRNFVNQSTLDIITTILSDYDFDWQLSEQLLSSEQLNAHLAMRIQSDVSDHDFIIGLLADIGVSTYWIDGDSVDELGYWSLVSALDENELLPIDYSYEKSSVQSGTDSVDALQMSAKQLGSRTVVVRADGLAADTIYEGVADDDSLLAFDDTMVLLGAPSRVHSDEAATRLAEQWVRAKGCQREYYTATGAMRGLSIGSSISINNLPSIGHLSTYCTSMTLVGIEPDSDSVSYHNQVLIKDWIARTAKQVTQTALSAIPEHGYDIARDTGIWVTATLLDAAIPYCPYPSQQSFVSSTYTGLTQARTGDTSTSSSPSYDSSVTDEGLQQTITTPVFSGISPHDNGVTPPLRSLQLSSGATHGWQFALRLGQSVLLNH